MTLRRLLPSLLALALVAAAVIAYAATRSTPTGDRAGADGCPPGYVSRETRERQERLEQLARGGEEGEREAEREAEEEGPRCVNRKTPEPQAELLTIHADDAKRSTGGITDTLKPGAYRAAVRERQALAADGRTLPGSGGTWTPAGDGPLINDDKRFTETANLGLGDINGRISDFATAPDGRVFAAVGEGGVWETTDGGASWHSIGDSLPTQAIGSVGYSPANGGTIVVSTGDSVFGGGGTFAGMGVFRTVDGGKSWQKAAGVPDGAISFKVAVDPSDPQVVYAATGAGLFRSENAGATFANVALPVGETAPGNDCTGAPFGKVGCFQANMVTDVVVQGQGNKQTPVDSPGAKAGSVVAVVGWRAGQKKSPKSDAFPEGYVESPNNGVYRSDTGKPGTFEKLAASGFTPQAEIGRVEIGLANGAEQNHNYLYAIVEDAVLFNGGTRPIDVSEETGAVPNTTVLDGIYVSDDFGATWTKMADAEELKDPTTGSALTGTACATLYCPGVQSWYNAWVKPDPTVQDASGVPTRLTFGLEEIWQNKLLSPQSGKSSFKVVGPYFGNNTCLFLNTGLPECPTTAGSGPTTTHPDQHAAIYLPGPQPESPARLFVGNDGGAYTQDVAHDADVNPDGWGRGANQGFYTLLPYEAQVAKDGTIYAGLQDNGELKIEKDRKQYSVFGGDGTFSAVDPDNSDVAYESYTNNAISKTTDGGKTFTSTPPPEDTYQFANPFVMDPLDASHLFTAGTSVHETTDGGENWATVFDLGTRKNPGTTKASTGADDPDNLDSAVDTRSIPTGGAGAGRATADIPEYTGGAGTAPDPASATVGTGEFIPGTYDDKPFTIKADEANSSATIEISFDTTIDDFDLYVLRDGKQIGSSATSEATEKVVLSSPPSGDYVVRVVKFAGLPQDTYKGKVTFKAAQGTQVGAAVASYVGYCGQCDALNARPFDNGIATNVTPDGKVGAKGEATNWHIAKATGLPKRYITSVQIDPADPRTVYATLAGYSRRWLPVGVLGENPDAGKGNVFKSTDAGNSFRDISGDLPDIPANWTTTRNGHLLVATNVGTFISADTDGGHYEVLGTGLPAAPTFTLEMKPKASLSEPDVLIAATQGRGVYRYEFKDPAKTAPPNAGGGTPLTPGGPKPPGGDTSSCLPSGGIKSVDVRSAGGGKASLAFTRRTNAPVTVDVFRVSTGRRVVRERLVARFRNRTGSVRWNGKANVSGGRKRVGDGYYFVRYVMKQGSRKIDARRLVLRRKHGRFTKRPDFFRRDRCDLLRRFKLERPVFGGPKKVTLKGAYQLSDDAKVTVTISKGSKVVRRYKAKSRKAGKTYRFALPAKRRAKGDYRVRVRAVSAADRVTATLTSRRL
ncbi:MAG TPA: hypothetical protein VF533_03285 [Solirubrobacteraceae bacterium]|jgi:photosystem II stability/assembly factor-like uncharacterized protein